MVHCLRNLWAALCPCVGIATKIGMVNYMWHQSQLIFKRYSVFCNHIPKVHPNFGWREVKVSFVLSKIADAISSCMRKGQICPLLSQLVEASFVCFHSVHRKHNFSCVCHVHLNMTSWGRWKSAVFEQICSWNCFLYEVRQNFGNRFEVCGG